MTQRTMTPQEVTDFLNAPPAHTAVLATVRPGGRPHAAPICFALDSDGSVVFTTGAQSVKGRNLLRDPWAVLCVDDDRPPFAFVILEGPVMLSEDMADLDRWARVLGGRYMGADRAAEFGSRNAVLGEVLVRMVPDRVVAMCDLAS